MDRARRSLIIGVTGQDGSLLSKYLLQKGYDVWGTSRFESAIKYKNNTVEGSWKLKLKVLDPTNLISTISLLDSCHPDEIYLLAAQSSVGLSFDQPTGTFSSITQGALNVLEAIRVLNLKSRLYHASSSECFGDVGDSAASEVTPFQPRSPYAVAKSSAHWLVRNYRESYGIYASNGILFNHESNLRPSRYVTKKIVSAACRIACGSGERVKLGRLDIVRDWGWAEEYVDAMWRILQYHSPDDFIVATGQSHSLMEFVQVVFSLVGLDWRRHVDIDHSLFRPTDISNSRGNPAKIIALVGWRACYYMPDVARFMIDAEMANNLPNSRFLI